jgi:hypothetical protein
VGLHPAVVVDLHLVEVEEEEVVILIQVAAKEKNNK